VSNIFKDNKHQNAQCTSKCECIYVGYMCIYNSQLFEVDQKSSKL